MNKRMNKCNNEWGIAMNKCLIRYEKSINKEKKAVYKRLNGYSI